MSVFTSSLSDEYITPIEVLNDVRLCLGSIELDPASSQQANQFVQAKTIFTIEDDALQHNWIAETCFLNPPFSKVKLFTQKFVYHYLNRDIKSGIILTKGDCSTQWFHYLLQYETAFVMLKKRLKFNTLDNKTSNSAPFPVVLHYFNTDMNKFYKTFYSKGTIAVPIR